MYRPKGWVNPYLGVDEDGFDKEYDGFAAFEAGAEAMLEGLLKIPVPKDIQTAIMNMEIDWDRPNGRVVFIPDEEIKKKGNHNSCPNRL
jgi:hypothetical protein